MHVATIQQTFLQTMAAAATTAAHIWPAYAACEAAVESGYERMSVQIPWEDGERQWFTDQFCELSEQIRLLQAEAV